MTYFNPHNGAARAEADARFLGAISNAKRLRILVLINGAEMCVGDLAREVGLSQSALSQHLRKLLMGGLVETRRDAQTIYYTCTAPSVRAMLITLHELGL